MKRRVIQYRKNETSRSEISTWDLARRGTHNFGGGRSRWAGKGRCRSVRSDRHACLVSDRVVIIFVYEETWMTFAYQCNRQSSYTSILGDIWLWVSVPWAYSAFAAPFPPTNPESIISRVVFFLDCCVVNCVVILKQNFGGQISRLGRKRLGGPVCFEGLGFGV